MADPARIAIVHEWFTAMRGGEKCVEALCELFPDATLFALLHVRGAVSPTIERMPIRTSFVQHLPGAARHYRSYLPLFPWAASLFDLRAFDLVISSHHCVAKAVHAPPGALHLCYCHTPMRYLWGQYDQYFGRERVGPMTRLAMQLVRAPLRRWDVRTAVRPRHYVANSENVRRRIAAIYRRPADVIYPPVDTGAFTLSTRDQGYHLIVSALVPYKRTDLAVAAFSRTGDRLIVVGDGPEAPRLRRLAGRSVSFTGWLPDQEVRDLMAGCTALIFPGEEDFGIVPVEAMACGKPVIAYGAGGALETVLEEPARRTGVLFREQTPESLIDAVTRCRATHFEPGLLRAWAETFDREVFKARILSYIRSRWAEFRQSHV